MCVSVLRACALVHARALVLLAVAGLCVYGVFFPMHFMGLAGVPRRYYSNSFFEMFDVFNDMNVWITVFATLSSFVQFLFIINFFYSIFRGKKATQNPGKIST